MEPKKLDYPFKEKNLRKAVAGLSKDGWADATGMVPWLLEHNSQEQLIAAVKEIWQASSLPLAQWSDAIQSVEVWRRTESLRLAVHLTDPADMIVWQASPFSAEDLNRYTAKLPGPLPNIARQIALVAPGLSFKDHGALVEPEHLHSPLAYLHLWMDDADEDETRRLGLECLDAGRQMIEIATNGLGDQYVLGVRGDLFFFDHEADGLVHCDVGFDELVAAYFKDSESIYDPFVNKWAKQPVEQPRTAPSPPSLPVLLRERVPQLAHLAGLALAVRSCHRALLRNYIEDVHRDWQPVENWIEELLVQCCRVTLTGEHLPSAVSAEAMADCSRALDRWRSIKEYEGCGFVPDILLVHSLPTLAAACAAIHNNEAVEEAVGWCHMVKPAVGDDLSRQLYQAAIADADWLLAHNLGEKGTVGLPVPREFFDRPAWVEE